MYPIKNILTEAPRCNWSHYLTAGVVPVISVTVAITAPAASDLAPVTSSPTLSNSVQFCQPPNDLGGADITPAPAPPHLILPLSRWLVPFYNHLEFGVPPPAFSF